MSQSDILTLLKLSDTKSDKRMATEAIARVFPSCHLNRTRKVNINLQIIVYFTRTDEQTLKLDQGSNIQQIKDLIKLSNDKVDNWRVEINRLLEMKNPNLDYWKATFAMYDNEVQKLNKYYDCLDRMYEREVGFLLEMKESTKLPQYLRSQQVMNLMNYYDM